MNRILSMDYRARNGSWPAVVWSVSLFYVVGIGVLQSRELIRRNLREPGADHAGVAKLLLPIAWLLAGAVFTAMLIVALSQQRYTGDTMPGTFQDFLLLPYFGAWLA